MSESWRRRVPHPRGIGRRVGLALFVVLALFGVAMGVAILSFERLAAADRRLTRLDQAKHAGHRVAALLREQYLHQAHTLIEWDDSHLDHYESAVQDTRGALLELRGLVAEYESEELVDEIVALARRSDEHFRTDALAAIRSSGRERAPQANSQLESLLERATVQTARLNQLLEHESLGAREYAARVRTQAELLILCCFGAAIVVGGIVHWLILRFVVGGITALRDGARRVGAGDLEARIRSAGDDEFGELAVSFNRMASDLSHHQAELLRAQRLASIGQVAAGVAHELNNPLGVILGYAQVMRRGADEALARDLDVVVDEAEQCRKIVEGLLDLARPRPLDSDELDLAAIVREVVERRAEALPPGAVLIEGPGPEIACPVTGDEGILRQVISNLLANAVEASPSEQRVGVELGMSGEEVRLRVSDAGPGFDAAALERAFEPFFTTKTSGSGLGLAIARAGAEAHGGRIEIDPEAAPGARVSLVLPRGPRAGAGG